MSPHSRSPSFSRRGVSKSPRRRNDRYGQHKERAYENRDYEHRQMSSYRRNRKYSGNSSSRSPTPRHRRRHVSRSRSRSPYAIFNNTREKPMESRCVGVFGLSVHTSQQKLREIFCKFGAIDRIQVVIDAQTGRSRGFCFIYYKNLSDAKVAKDTCSGMEVDGRRIRVDYSITQRPHSPTPGVYMGRSLNYQIQKYGQERTDFHRSRRRSPSYSRSDNYKYERRRRYDRSASRSISPRRGH